ncbi:MAG: hypothetical protein V4484_13400 [Pseudomonadota bacterium]
MIKTRLFCFVLALVLVNAATAAVGDIVIFRANVDALAAMDRADDPPVTPGYIQMSVPTKASISVIETVFGQIREGDKSITMPMSHWPIGNTLTDVFFIAKRNADGSLSATWWEYSRKGHCVPQHIAEKLAVEDVLRELYGAGKLKCQKVGAAGSGGGVSSGKLTNRRRGQPAAGTGGE